MNQSTQSYEGYKPTRSTQAKATSKAVVNKYDVSFNKGIVNRENDQTVKRAEHLSIRNRVAV